jgi:hypothetical protein
MSLLTKTGFQGDTPLEFELCMHGRESRNQTIENSVLPLNLGIGDLFKLSPKIVIILARQPIESIPGLLNVCKFGLRLHGGLPLVCSAKKSCHFCGN